MIVDCAIYEDGVRRDGKVELAHAYDERHQAGKFVWIGLYEPTEAEFDSLRREFDLHPLAVEDAIHAHQRPKLEVYEDMVFLVLKTARYVDPTEVIELGEVLVFLGEDFLITVRHGEASSLTAVREALDAEPKRLKHGPSSALHAILDRIVDDYQPAIEGLDTDIDEVEEQLFSGERVNPAERILPAPARGAELPQGDRAAGRADREAGPRPLHADPPGGARLLPRRQRPPDPGARPARRDARPPVELAQANLAQVGVRQNEDMRRISAWVAIIAVPTAIAGIYGMNFDAHAGAALQGRLPAVRCWRC